MREARVFLALPMYIRRLPLLATIFEYAHKNPCEIHPAGHMYAYMNGQVCDQVQNNKTLRGQEKAPLLPNLYRYVEDLTLQYDGQHIGDRDKF